MSVKTLFSEDLSLLAKRFVALEGLEAISALKNNFLQKTDNIKWSDLFAEVSQEVEGLLDIKLEDVLIRAWKKHQEIKKICRQGKISTGRDHLLSS